MRSEPENTLNAPHMEAKELALLDKYLPRGGSVLEFGAGGSTVYFFERGVNRLVSVESDQSFLEALAKRPVLQGRDWLPLHADIGPVEAWGWPVSDSPEDSWLNYHQLVWSRFQDRNFDLILIDGRFRVACACQAVLHCANPSVNIIVHDFLDRLAKYRPILQFCKIVEAADTMIACEIRPGYERESLLAILEEHKFDPA